MSKIELQLPEGNSDPIDFFLKNVKNTENVGELILTKAVYERMKSNPDIKQMAMLWASFEHPAAMWKANKKPKTTSITYILEYVSVRYVYVRVITTKNQSINFLNEDGRDIIIIV